MRRKLAEQKLLVETSETPPTGGLYCLEKYKRQRQSNIKTWSDPEKRKQQSERLREIHKERRRLGINRGNKNNEN